MADDTNIEDKKVKDGSIFFSYLVVVFFLAVLAVFIVAKALNTAFVEKDRWLALSKTQIMPDRTVLPSRGNIYSYDGKLMATSVPRYYTYLDFKADGFLLDTFLYSKRNGLDSLSIYLSRKFKDRSPAGYKSHLLRGLKSKSRQYPVHVGKVSYSDLKEMKKFSFLRLNRFKSGFYTKEMVDRQRPFGTLAARTIGDVYGEIDTSGVTKGKNGLELQYDSLLRGKPGVSSVRRIGGRWTNVIEQDPEEGMDIRSTIDIDIQDITEKSLLDMLKKIDAASGTAVVMEVKTGEIKAITKMGRIREGVYGET